MPTYRYRCDQCDAVEEHLHRSNKRFYIKCPGCGHAPMTWQFPTPNVQTGSTWLANRDDGFGTDDFRRKRAYAKARAAGVNPSGKVYCPSLCPLGEPLSPKAWISDKADAKAICQANNWSSDDLGVKSRPVEKDPEPYHVAPDLVQDEVERIVESREGDVSPKEHEELFHTTAERLKGNM